MIGCCFYIYAIWNCRTYIEGYWNFSWLCIDIVFMYAVYGKCWNHETINLEIVTQFILLAPGCRKVVYSVIWMVWDISSYLVLYVLHKLNMLKNWTLSFPCFVFFYVLKVENICNVFCTGSSIVVTMQQVSAIFWKDLALLVYFWFFFHTPPNSSFIFHSVL